MHGRTNHAWINIWKGGDEFMIRRVYYIVLSIEASEFQSLDI